MSRAATKRRTPHTCQYAGQACAACAEAGRVAVGPEAQAAMRRAMEGTRGYRNQEHIESVKLPRHMNNKHVSGYGPNGEPRFRTRKGYIEAGRAAGMQWQ